mmetsp:Transcript_26103/g.39945  ORF Transcript_26103/g.39945 Transcript_26103/m.39945 type:complete len:91 (+) Transcript_26103:227-499(+)
MKLMLTSMRLHPLGFEMSPHEKKLDSCTSLESNSIEYKSKQRSQDRVLGGMNWQNNHSTNTKKYVYHRNPTTGHSIRTLVSSMKHIQLDD